MNKHNCIKCGSAYEDEDVDAYYCPPCVVEKTRIAKEIDMKLKDQIPSRVEKSGFQIYNELPKTRGFVNAADLHNMGLL